jgi:hypothetical protein
MPSLINNPFAQERTKVAIPRRRGGQTAQPSLEDITRTELDKHLRAVAEGKQAEPAIEAKFNEYLQNGNSYGYLDDTAVRTLFSQYVKKQIADGNAENLGKLIGPDSVFADYVERRRYKTDSIESQLFDYTLLALKQKKEGKDPNVEPVSLTAEGLEGFVEHLTDKDKGLSFKATKLDQLRTSSDPMMRLLRDAASKLGLKEAIDVTKKQLRAGESTAMTEKLGESLPELLKKEEARLNEILPPGGGLVVARKSDGTTTTVGKIDISSSLSQLGPDAADEFTTGTSLDFGEFFRTAHKLSLGGDTEKQELAKHVSDGLSLILAYHKAAVKAAEAAGNQDDVRRANEDFKLIARTIQGKGLLPTRLAKIIRETASAAIMSDDFRNRAAVGDIGNLSQKLSGEFIAELKGGNREIASLAGMKDFVGTSGNDDNKIAVIDPDSFKVEYHDVNWVETNEIKDVNSANNNRFLTSGSPLSAERVLQAYRRTVDKACEKVYAQLAARITGKENVVPKKTLDNLAHKTEEAIAAEFSSVGDVTKLVVGQLIAYKDSRAASADGTGMDNALRKFVEETLNITDGKEKSNLWKGTTNTDGKTTYGPIATAVSSLKTAILTSPNKGNGTSANNDSVENAVTGLVKALQDTQVGADVSAQETSLFARFKESKGKDRLRSLMSSLRVKAEESEDLSKTLDLDKVVQIFDGAEGKKLQRGIEDLSQPGSKFSDIKDKQDSEQFGEFATLLFAKDDKGGIDEAKRLTALARLIRKVAGTDEALQSSMCSHIVSKLKGNAVKSTDETALALRLKKAVGDTIEAATPTRVQIPTDLTNELDDANVALNAAIEALPFAIVGNTITTTSFFGDSSTTIATEENAIINAQRRVTAAKQAIDNLNPSTATNQDLATWIDNVVITSQQRSIVLRGAFQNMQRQLDNLRGHFSAVAMRYFGDQQAYSANLRPAVDDITNAADNLDKDSPDALNRMKESLKNNDHALTMFEQLVNGLQVNPLKAPEAHNEHPGDIIDRIVSFLQSAIYSPVLSLWKGATSAIAGKAPSEVTTEKPKRDESGINAN